MKAKAITDYIKKYSQSHNWLYFNVVLKAPGRASVITDSDNTIQEYLDGSKDKEYQFMVEMAKNYDTGTSDANMEALEEIKEFIDWINENEAKGIYPEFPDNCMIESIEVLGEMPEVVVDPTKNIARYRISLKIKYLERKV